VVRLGRVTGKARTVSAAVAAGAALVIALGSGINDFPNTWNRLSSEHEEFAGFSSVERVQEPGTAQEIATFCKLTYGVTFPMFEKVQVKPGEGLSPIYAWLESSTGQVPSWNFCKYLVGKDGKVIQFYSSKTTPESTELRSAIETALAAK